MVTNDFSRSGLDLNDKVTLTQPTALEWGPDGRLYVTEVDGNVKVLTVAFGSPNPDDENQTNAFYVTSAETLNQVKGITNHNDDGTDASGSARQVTGISVVPRYDADGNPVMIDGKPAVSVYVTSSDSRIGAGNDGEDSNLDTNSGTITRIDQTSSGWEATDIVRGLARSEENHSLNGLEVVQELDDQGKLVSERLIVANGGNTNTGAPSNNFAGQQETAYSGAILEIDLDQLKTMKVLTDADSGRKYIYDVPTLDDPTREGENDTNDPFGGNDGLNGGKIDPNGPVQIYSAGYRNAYDVEVTEDGRVWTYDNGANNSWGGRPVGEAGESGKYTDNEQLVNFIATNLNNGDGNSGDSITLEKDWDPKNYDQFHEITRSDDLKGRELSAGKGGAATYEWTDPDSGETLTLVYGGHPNPTRASGGQSGLLFTPEDGVENSYLMLSDVDKSGENSSDYDVVMAFLKVVEKEYDNVNTGDLTGRVIAVTPGEQYYITKDGGAYLVSDYSSAPSEINGKEVLGKSGMPKDFDSVVAKLNPIEGNYLEGGYTDGAIDSGKGSINGLTEYTSTIFDDADSGMKMSGAIFAASLGQGNLTIMGRDENGLMNSKEGGKGPSLAAERDVVDIGGAPLGLASIGDNLAAFNGQKAFQGSVWATIFKQGGPAIEILQPDNGKVPLAGSIVVNSTDRDQDGVDHINDPFEFDADNGLDLAAGERIVLDFDPTKSPYPGTINDTGLMGAALDGKTPNRDAKTEEENFEADQLEDGLYDLGGNIIPGGNAPIFQIKKVVGGTVVGSDNSARDAMHVGINPGDDVESLVINSKIKNWMPSGESLVSGQLTGVMLGDGTQENFLRLVFGTMVIDGELAAGFEVGYEVEDTYTTLARVAVPQLTDGSVSTLGLQLAVNTANGFEVEAGYRLGNDKITSIDLNGFSLPPGVLQDILTGNHTITDGDTTLPSGAAVGFLAETSALDAASEKGLAAIDFYNLEIEARGNAIQVGTTGEDVGVEGTDGIDTIVYTGSDEVLAPLADNVENFDGSGSDANFTVIGNAGDNILIAGSGDNTFIGGDGADSVRGSFATIDGSVVEDFQPEDDIQILDSYLTGKDVSYRVENGVVKLVFTDPSSKQTATISLTGDQFKDFDPSDGASVFNIELTNQGTRITYSEERVLYRINAGGDDVAAIDGGPDWLGDKTTGFEYLLGNTKNTYSGKATDEQSEIDLSGLGDDIVPWQLYTNERSDNTNDEQMLEYGFPVTSGGTYSITLYYTENWDGIFNDAGGRSFDVAVDGNVPDIFSGINPLAEAKQALGSEASQDELLGYGLSRTYTFTAQDDVINLAFKHGAQNPKINAIEIKQLGLNSATDTTPPPAVDVAPQVDSIQVEEATDSDSSLQVKVTLSDDKGIDVDAIQGNELVFTGIEPASVALAEDNPITVSADGKSATITYVITPPQATNAWPEGAFKVGVNAGSYQDSVGNGTPSYETSFDIDFSESDTGGGTDTGNDVEYVSMFELDFETAGNPLEEGGFDGLLGGIDDGAVVTSVENGKLVINTSDGDISKGASANDFIKNVDLSDASQALVEIATRFSNAFPAALEAQGLSSDQIPNYAQQGIVFGTGSQGNNELVKLTLGGNKGNIVQLWSNGSGKDPENIDDKYVLEDLLVDKSQGLKDVANVEMTLQIDKAAGTVTPIVTLYGTDDVALGGLRAKETDGFVTAKAQTLPSAVLENLLDSDVPTAVGVTSNDYKTMSSFQASWEYLNVTASEGNTASEDGAGSDDDATLSAAEQAFADASLETSESYSDDAVGSATIAITPGGNVQKSSYDANSFQITNTGDKKIAAVYFDVSSALYDDSVFDSDGKGGDSIFKPLTINSAGTSGAIQPSEYEHYFQPGVDPDPENDAVNGGFKGAMIKFSATQEDGFSEGETVGFSADMDPNSIAGMDKRGEAGVDTGTVPDWDVGGVSGAELIGSKVYIAFTDGSVAHAQLMADGSQSGAQALVTQAPRNNAEVKLIFDNVTRGEDGAFEEAPTVEVSGPANEWVRVVMTKGHQPVVNEEGGIASIVEERLGDNAFSANNAAEFQFADVQLDGNGFADVSAEFVYDEFQNGTASFEGSDALPVAFVAAVIGDPATTEAFALGGVSEPVYLL
nr:malectin domain-containing carbohydrate-binding protein [uncultured Halomonas sp.]